MNTLKYVSSFSVIVKKSKFIGFAYRVDTVSDVETIIKSIEQKYHDARHIVYAYKIGETITKKENSSEPAGTAGTPILCAIENHNLTNSLVVVVRYFGGVLLGAGNLYRAYGDCANGAVEANEIEQLSKFFKYDITVNYIDYAMLNSLASKTKEIVILDAVFEENVKIVLAVQENVSKEFIANLIKEKTRGDEVWL